MTADPFLTAFGLASGQPLHQQTAPRAEYFIPQWEERTSYGVRRIDPFAKLFEERIIFLLSLIHISEPTRH